MFLWAMAISLLVIFATAIPPVGPILFVALMPIVTLMTLSACKHVEADRVMLPSMWPAAAETRRLSQAVPHGPALCGALHGDRPAGLPAVLRLLSEAVRVASMEKDITPLLSALMVP